MLDGGELLHSAVSGDGVYSRHTVVCLVERIRRFKRHCIVQLSGGDRYNCEGPRQAPNDQQAGWTTPPMIRHR